MVFDVRRWSDLAAATSTRKRGRARAEMKGDEDGARQSMAVLAASRCGEGAIGQSSGTAAAVHARANVRAVEGARE
jgi:hypothetical protein